MSADPVPLHLKYRPKTLDEIIGHESTVTELKGMLAKKKFPSAMIFLGPPSAGKTTFAYAFAAELLGKDKDMRHHPSFSETNAGDKRTIEDVRAIIARAKLYPMDGPRRFEFIDEAHQILSNAPAAQALLKPLEHPVPTTTWILGSMEPEKFQSTTTGRAILSRCQQYVLKAPTPEALRKFAIRIVRGEEFTFFTKELITAVVDSSDSMRVLAQRVEALANHYAGMEKPPEKLDPSAVTEILAGAESDDDKTVVRLLTAVYMNKGIGAQKELLRMVDGFGFINKLMYVNFGYQNLLATSGELPRGKWVPLGSRTLLKNMNDLKPDEERGLRYAKVATVTENLASLKVQASTFSLPEDVAVSAFIVRTIRQLQELG